MSPLVLLALLVATTLVAVLVDRGRRRAVAKALRRLAVTHKMHYSPGDPLRVTPRVAAAVPVPGAAAVRVIDLMYRTDAAGHHYVFTAEYTVGVVTTKRRVRRAAAFDEPRGATGAATGVRLAAEDLALIEQYESLLPAPPPLR
jgi:hypothetical protein